MVEKWARLGSREGKKLKMEGQFVLGNRPGERTAQKARARK
jgi:hypothetical protein